MIKRKCIGCNEVKNTDLMIKITKDFKNGEILINPDKLKENWLSLVSPDDTVVLPGDISWAMTLPEAAADLGWLDALPGMKIIFR